MCIKKGLMMTGLVAGLVASNVVFAAYATSDPIGGDISRMFGLDSKAFSAGATDDDADVFMEAGSGNITLSGSKKYEAEGWVATFGSGDGAVSNLFNVYQDNSVSDPLIPSSSTRGRFEISSDAWNQYSAIAIGLKVGQNKNPDWAFFKLEDLATAGYWFVTPEQGGGLSHFLIYTKTGGTPPSEVPLPGAFWLLGSALLGMIGLSRKKRVSA